MIETIAQIWANKHVSSRMPMPVPTPVDDVDVAELNAVHDAERHLLDLAASAVAKKLRQETPEGAAPRRATPDELRDMAAAIAVEVLEATESQARVDRTVLQRLQS